MSERDIAAALQTGQHDAVQRAVNREILRAAVMRQITCPRSGQVLDVRRAVLVTVSRGEQTVAMQVLDAAAYDEIAEQLRQHCEGNALRLELLDGRELHRRPKRRT